MNWNGKWAREAASAVRIPENGLLAPNELPEGGLERELERIRLDFRSKLEAGWQPRAAGRPASDSGAGAFSHRIARSLQSEFAAGLGVLIFGVGLIVAWGALYPLSGAVVVPASLTVESSVKKVQHPTGGVVAEIAVHDGQHVEAGDLVARLDATQTRANLDVIETQINELRARIARLAAERDGVNEFTMPAQMTAAGTEKDRGVAFAAERTLFRARSNTRASQKELLRRQIGQIEEQINGLNAQINAKAKQIGLIAEEIQGVQSLYSRQLVPLTRLNALQRDAARLEGERGQLLSAIAEARSKISEQQLQIVRIDQEFQTEVMKDLREAQGKEAELTGRSIAARDLLERIDIRATSSGVISQLAVHTVGGVIGAGEIVMEIVPEEDQLRIEGRLQPNDIDQVRVGQLSLIKFPAFNQRTTPQLEGRVSYISADLVHDKQTNAAYYTVRATLSADELQKLGDRQLISGMPVEMYLQTGERTMLSYLFKPITDQLQRAFRER